MAETFEIAPAVRDALQRLLRREDVTQLVISKDGPLVEVGIRRRATPMRWFPGATLFGALDRAEDALAPRIVVEESVGPRIVVEEELP